MPGHILYSSDYPYLLDAFLHTQLDKLKQTLAQDKELANYADMFLWKNAETLFVKPAGPTIFGRSNVFMLLEEPAEVLRMLKTLSVRYLRYDLSSSKPILGRPDYELTYVVAGRVSGSFFITSPK